jgi:hypothetical protein
MCTRFAQKDYRQPRDAGTNKQLHGFMWQDMAPKKTDNGETKSKNDPTNNKPKDEELITEKGTGIDTDQEYSTQAGPSIPIQQELHTLTTDSDNRCNLELPGTTETER